MYRSFHFENFFHSNTHLLFIITGDAIDIESSRFINRDDAMIDLIALKFGMFRCAGGEQWHFELTNVALDEAEINQHLTGAKVNVPSNSSSNSNVIDKSDIIENESNEDKSDKGTKEIKTETNYQDLEIKNDVIDEIPKETNKEIKNNVVKSEVDVEKNISDKNINNLIKKEPAKKAKGDGYISASVGKGGENIKEDVKFVAFRLYALGYPTGVSSLMSGMV